MLDFFKYIFEGETWFVLLKIGVCLLTLFIIHQCWFYAIGKDAEQGAFFIAFKFLFHVMIE